MAVTAEDVAQSLTRVPCPCALAMGHEMNLVEMGKIEDITVQDRRVTIRLIESPVCFFIRPIVESIEDAVRDTGDVDEVVVDFSDTTLWTPDLIKPGPAPAGADESGRRTRLAGGN
jgi:metal-sulfur cluster biosynthetic enzyme